MAFAYSLQAIGVIVSFLLCHVSAQSFGPGTHDGCEDAGWVRVAGSCYYLPSKSAVENAPMRTQAAANGYCTSLTAPRIVQIGNDSISVNFTDNAQLASFASHSAWEGFVNAASVPYGGSVSEVLKFWIGCSFSAASGMAVWSDGVPFLYANWQRSGVLSSFAADGECIAALAQFSLADAWTLSPAGAPAPAFPLCKRRAKLGGCPLGWITAPGSSGRCYLPQSDVQRTYNEAKSDCAALASAPSGPGAGSAPVLSRWETAGEASSVISHAIPQSNDAAFYIDLVRDWNTPQGFRWGGPGSGGPPMGASPGVNWNSYQPSNFGGAQSHVVALNSFAAGLSDVDGRVDRRGYLCESAPEDAADYNLAQLLTNTGRSGDVHSVKHLNDCPAGWTQHGHRCFMAQRPSSRKTFSEARSICAGLATGADLASVEGATDDVFQRSLYLSLPAASSSDTVVTGAEYDSTAGEWSWVDGNAWDTLATNQPVGSQNNDHVFLDLNNAFSSYFDAMTVQRAGVTAHGFVCGQPLSSPGGCAEGWVRDPRTGMNDCWMLGTHKLFQAEGESHCQAMGGELASLHSMGDVAVARSILSPSSLTGDLSIAFIAPVDDVIGTRYGPIQGGQPAFANYTLRNADGSPWDFSSWGGSLPDLAVWTLPARVQLQSHTGRMASSRAPAADRWGYICRATAAGSKRWRPPPALTGGGTTTANTGTDSDFDTTTSDASLAQYGFMGNVYRADEPCPFGGGWVPVNAWCYKAVSVAAGMQRSAAASTCEAAAPGAMLAPLAEYGEAEAAGTVTELNTGQRLWFGCSVRNAPGQPGHGEVFLDDGTPLKYANWGPSFNASTHLVPGWGCTLYTSPSSGVPLWRVEPPSGQSSVQYGAVCAIRAQSTKFGDEECGLGWRYVQNKDEDGDYCYSNIRQRGLYYQAEEVCDAQGATTGAIVDMQQSERLDTFFRHPLVSSEETYWIGIARMQNGNGCAWGNVNTGQLLGSAFTRWEVPDAQGTSCTAPGVFVRITRLWGVPGMDTQARAVVCQLRPAAGTQRALSNPRGFVAFLPPVQAGSFFASQLNAAPAGSSVCGVLAGDATAHPVLVTMTSTDGEGWPTGLEAVVSGATVSRSSATPPQPPMRVGRGFTSQTYLCLQPTAPSNTCPAITLATSAPAPHVHNVAITVTDAQPSTGASAILAHGRAVGVSFKINLPGVPGCVAAQPSADPTPASTSAATIGASASSTPSADVTIGPSTSLGASPAGTPTAIPTGPSTPSAAATPASTPSAAGTPGATPSAPGTPAATPSAPGTPAATPSAAGTPAVSSSPRSTVGPADGPGGRGGGTGGADATPAASSGSDPNGAGGGSSTGGGTPGASENQSDEGGSRDSTTPLAVGLVVVGIVVVAFAAYMYRRNNAPSPVPKTIAHDVQAPGASLQYFGGGPQGIELGSAGVVNPLSTASVGSGAQRAATIHGRQGRVTTGQRRAMPPPY